MKTLFRLASIVSYAIVIWILAPAPAHADPSFGRQTIGASASGGMSADFKRGSKFTLPENGSTYYYCAYLDGLGGGSGNQNFDFVVYRDNAGVPGEKVAEVAGGQISAGQRANWLCLSTVLVPLSAGDYWLTIHTSGAPGVIRYFYDGPTGWYGGPDIYADGASNPFGSGAAGAGTISIIAYYSTQFHAAGYSGIALSRSGGMSADFKRATRITVTESGVLHSMPVYLDGLGGAAGEQQVSTALYRDANGVPGPLVTQTYPVTVSAGQLGFWKFDVYHFPEAKLTPGTYWIALLSSGQSGVARYGLKNTSTNTWYGNANPFAGGFSNPFGAGNPGSGTMSAYVNYQPGTFTPGTLAGR